MLLRRKSSGPKRSEMRPQWLVRPPSMRERNQSNWLPGADVYGSPSSDQPPSAASNSPKCRSGVARAAPRRLVRPLVHGGVERRRPTSGPASSMTTLAPACVSTIAAMPPPAPDPIDADVVFGAVSDYLHRSSHCVVKSQRPTPDVASEARVSDTSSWQRLALCESGSWTLTRARAALCRPCRSQRGLRPHHPVVSWRWRASFGVAARLRAARRSPAASPSTTSSIVAPAAPGGGWDQTARALQQVIERQRPGPRRRSAERARRRRHDRAGAVRRRAGAATAQALLVNGLVMLGATLWNDSPVSIAPGDADRAAHRRVRSHRRAGGVAAPRHASLVARSARRPEAFAWGGGSAGGTDHILAGLIAAAAGVDPRRINYIAFSGGGEAVAALLGGHVTAGISGYSEFARAHRVGPPARAGDFRAARVPGIDVPTIRESGLDVEMVELARRARRRRHHATRTARAHGARAPRGAQRRLAAACSSTRGWTDLYLAGPAFDAVPGRRAHAALRPHRGAAARPGARRARSPSASGIVPCAVLGGGAAILLMARDRARLSRPRDGRCSRCRPRQRERAASPACSRPCARS